jgi:hypothetical protein
VEEFQEGRSHKLIISLPLSQRFIPVSQIWLQKDGKRYFSPISQIKCSPSPHFSPLHPPPPPFGWLVMQPVGDSSVSLLLDPGRIETQKYDRFWGYGCRFSAIVPVLSCSPVKRKPEDSYPYIGLFTLDLVGSAI